MTNTITDKNKIIESDVKLLVTRADGIIENTISNIKKEIIVMYFNIGKMIADYKVENSSKYGESVINDFVKELQLKYGAGFNKSNIYYAIKFYEMFSNFPLAGNSVESNFPTSGNSVKTIFQPAGNSMIQNITWSHIREILSLNNLDEINYYIKEVNNKEMTIKEIRSAIKSKSYERTISNQKSSQVRNEIEKTLKDPVILNVENKKRSEKQLEDMIIENIFDFMKEIGNSVMLYGRQYKININGLRHRVDLVFFDNEINSYILVDLKINKVTNKDIFQMQMYIEYFNKHMKKDVFNNTVGIILCETKDARVLTNDDIYQVKYLNEIPKEKDLLKIINENKIILLKTENLKLENEK